MISACFLSLNFSAVSSPIYQSVAEAAGQILKPEMAKTLTLMEENRTHLDSVSKELLVKNRSYRNTLGKRAIVVFEHRQAKRT